MKRFQAWKVLVCCGLLAGVAFGAWFAVQSSREKEKSRPFREDYAYLWGIIEKNYPASGVLARQNNVDLGALKEKYRRQAEKSTDAKSFYHVLEQCLGEFAGQGHMGIVSKELYMSYRSYENYPDALSQFIFSQINGQNSLQFYDVSFKAPTMEKLAGQAAPGQSYVALAGGLNFATVMTSGDQEVGYIKLRGMQRPETDIQPMENFFRSIESQNIQACIIDMRDNSGGSTEYWEQTIVRPNLGEPVRYNSYGLYRGEESKKYIQIAGFTPRALEDGFPFTGAQRPEDASLMDGYIELNHSILPGESGPLFTGKFYLLVNEKNYSAAESFAVFCKNTGFAQLVGTPTGGDGVGFTPSIYALPNTGICFRFSSILGLNTDGTSNEEHGTTPDVLVGENENSYQVCLDLIGGKTT